MSLVLEHQGQSVRAVSLCHSLNHFSVISTEHMSNRAITHWLLMEHKTEVDLPFTVGSTTASLWLKCYYWQHRETHTERHKHACKQVLENHIFSMNYKCTPSFFLPSNQWQNGLILPVEGKKKRLFPRRWTMDCYAGGKIAVIEMVMSSLYLITFGFEMHSPGWQFELQGFPISLLSVFVGCL